MNTKTILCCVIVVIINDYVYLYVNQLFYSKALVLTILYLLFDIFRIHHDYLLVSKELEVLQKHDKYILEEIRYNTILLKENLCRLEAIKMNLTNIISYCKKFNNHLKYSS